MARLARLVLDGALFSLKIVKPAIGGIYNIAKQKLERTRVKPIFDSQIVKKIETYSENFSSYLITQTESLRDDLLPLEERYLRRQLGIVQEKIRKQRTIKQQEPHTVVFHQVTQDINVKKEKLIDVIKEKYELSNNTQLGQKLKVLKEYWKVEMAPPGSGQIQRIKLDLQVAKEFFRSGAWKEMTVKQAWLLFLVIVEVGLWFFLGETVGKMSFVGYKV